MPFLTVTALLCSALGIQHLFFNPVIPRDNILETRFPQNKDCYNADDTAIFRMSLKNTSGEQEYFDLPVIYTNPGKGGEIKVVKHSLLPYCEAHNQDLPFSYILWHFPLLPDCEKYYRKEEKTCDLHFNYWEKISVTAQIDISELNSKEAFIARVSAFLDTCYVGPEGRK